jgi:bifunctional non-homologous end joining protein LigD
MECKRVSKLPEGGDWLYEIKQDGYRAIALVDGTTALLYSMSGLDYTREFAHIAFALKNLKRGNLVLDGEIVALDERGRANFQQLQNRKRTRYPILYYVFDLLHKDGNDLLARSLSERRQILEDVGSRFSDPLRLNPIFETPLAELMKEVKRLGLEGIVAKRASSIYLPGRRSESWQKQRLNQEGRFIIGGYVRAGKNFSSLLVGEYRAEKLYYLKRVAAGFTPALREEVYAELRPLAAPESPFVNLPEPNRSGHGLTAEKMKECVWLKPERRCELEFVERTQGGRLRHALFRRLVG